MDEPQREYNNNINRIYEKALTIVYRDKKRSTFKDLSEKGNSVTTHMKKTPSISNGNV